MNFRIISFIACILLLGGLAGCAQQYYNVATEQDEIYFYSSEKEAKIGRSLSGQVEKTYKLDNDPLVQKSVNDVGQKIFKVCDRKEIYYYFRVLEKDEVNAFALPGGYVYVFRGLWDKIKDDQSKIAAVLAHEVAHIAARHSIKRMQSSLGTNVLTVLVAASSKIDSYSKSKAISGINELIMAYSREDELAADKLAVKYLDQAGFQTEAIIEVLKILQDTDRARPIGPAHWRTHPYISERMAIVRSYLDKGNIKFNDYINTK